jgi:DnaJ-class molecular chaperone
MARNFSSRRIAPPPIDRPDVCRDCGGSGWVKIYRRIQRRFGGGAFGSTTTYTCDRCNGTGKDPDYQEPANGHS